MPMYEYKCGACDETFTLLMRMGADEKTVECPACGKKKAKKLMSAPAVHDPDRGLPSESTMRNAMSQMQQQTANSPCASGMCGSGNSCSIKEFGGD